MSKIYRFFEKVKYTYEYAKFLWQTNCIFEYDHIYLIKIVEFKIKRMHAFLSSEDAIAIHSKKELNRMLEVLEHLKRYYDMDDYNPYKSDKCSSPGRRRISYAEIKHNRKNSLLEQWHLQEAFRKIGKYAIRWWD